MRPAVVCIAVGLLTPLAVADEVRLQDGRVLVGATKTVGTKLTVTTLDGEVSVPLDEVVRVRTDDELRAELEHLAAQVGNQAHARLQLARTARDFGLWPEMWEEIQWCRRHALPDNAATKFADLLASLEPVVLPKKWRSEPTTIRVRELLFRVKPNAPKGLDAVVEELLVREPAANDALRVQARAASQPERRLVAVRALARRGEEGNNRFVCRTTIIDASPQVRADAGMVVRDAGWGEFAVQYLAGGLMHDSPLVRVRTAEAFGHIAHPAGVEALVDAGPHAGTPRAGAGDHGGVRGNMSVIHQQAYIRDFDVEVAQAAAIGNPVVGTLQSGVVLDVTVAAVVSERTHIIGAYRRALHHVTGSDPGSIPAKWREWFDSLRAQPQAATTEGR